MYNCITHGKGFSSPGTIRLLLVFPRLVAHGFFRAPASQVEDGRVRGCVMVLVLRVSSKHFHTDSLGGTREKASPPFQRFNYPLSALSGNPWWRNSKESACVILDGTRFANTGGLGSLQHGDEVGCGPSCNIINAELSTARIWLPEELLTGPASEPEPRLEARMTYPWEDPARLPNLVELDFSSSEIPHGDRVPPFDTEGRHAMSNRMALTSMGGIAGEMMANGFDVVSDVFLRVYSIY